MKKKCALYGLAALFAVGTILHAAQGTPETAPKADGTGWYCLCNVKTSTTAYAICAKVK
jgi:hypothetical protein